MYPREVEAAIESHPLVRSSAVIGLPDDDLGQRVHAVVDVASAAPTDDLLADLRTHVAAQLAPYKVPRVFELVHDALRDEAGKVRRSALREARLATGQVGEEPSAARRSRTATSASNAVTDRGVPT